jgi:carbon storage regulator
MLVLSRHRDESLILFVDGREIRVTIVEVRHDRKVRVGVEAEPDVVIHREEVVEAIRRNGGDPADPKARRHYP